MGGAIDRVRLYRSPKRSRLWSHAQIQAIEESGRSSSLGSLRVYEESGETVAELEGIRLRYVEESDAGHDLANALYRVQWTSVGKAASSSALDGLWLIVRDATSADELASKVAQTIGERGGTAVLIDLPIDGTAIEFPHNCRGVLHLAGITPVSLARAAVTGCGVALRIVQHLAQENEQGAGARLCIVTRGGQQIISDEPVDARQAPLWGFGRSIALELPDRWGGLIDLDPDADDGANARLLVDELDAGNDEDQIAFRAGGRFIARLSRVPPPAVMDGPRFRPDATYVITGGLTGIGLETAAWMIGAGARRLVLAGRTRLPARSQWLDVNHDPETARRVCISRSWISPTRTRLWLFSMISGGRDGLLCAASCMLPEFCCTVHSTQCGRKILIHSGARKCSEPSCSNMRCATNHLISLCCSRRHRPY
jgi:acyl transferase domain-containing protein